MNKIAKVIGKNGPLILTALGIVGMAATAVLAYKSYPAVTDKLLEKSDEVYEQENREQLTKMEKAEVYVKTLWPTFALGAVSGIMVVLGHKEQVRRTSALATAYCLSETTLKEYQKAVIEEIGEKKERAIHDKVNVAKMEKVEPTKETIILSDDNKPWIFDSATGAYFRMSYEKFKRHIAEANLEMYKNDYLSVADLYEVCKLEIPPGYDAFRLGWRACDGDIEIYTTSAIRRIMDTEQPCMVVEYNRPPKMKYDCYG